MDGRCGRSFCNNTIAFWWNNSTRKFYCQPCAFKINDINPGTCVKMPPRIVVTAVSEER